VVGELENMSKDLVTTRRLNLHASSCLTLTSNTAMDLKKGSVEYSARLQKGHPSEMKIEYYRLHRGVLSGIRIIKVSLVVELPLSSHLPCFFEHLKDIGDAQGNIIWSSGQKGTKSREKFVLLIHARTGVRECRAKNQAVNTCVVELPPCLDSHQESPSH
jgi:hypothetical protein